MWLDSARRRRINENVIKEIRICFIKSCNNDTVHIISIYGRLLPGELNVYKVMSITKINCKFF
jgi:hypothetical protein